MTIRQSIQILLGMRLEHMLVVSDLRMRYLGLGVLLESLLAVVLLEFTQVALSLLLTLPFHLGFELQHLCVRQV